MLLETLWYYISWAFSSCIFWSIHSFVDIWTACFTVWTSQSLELILTKSTASNINGEVFFLSSVNTFVAIHHRHPTSAANCYSCTQMNCLFVVSISVASPHNQLHLPCPKSYCYHHHWVIRYGMLPFHHLSLSLLYRSVSYKHQIQTLDLEVSRNRLLYTLYPVDINA